MSSVAVFGYASLVDTTSAAQTLGRSVEIAAVARLRGWSRSWSLARDNLASEKTFARPDGSLPGHCLGLNVHRSDRPTDPNGVLIEISEAELERLDVREIRYSRVEVGAAIELGPGHDPHPFAAVFTYTARAEHHHPTAPPNSIIVATYPAAVEAGFAALGVDQLRTYRETTAAAPVEAVEASLVMDRIPPGNPRRW